MKPDVWRPNRAYTFLRYYVDWCTRQSYRRLAYLGENLPEDGAVILAPNHTNTLMDALVILAGRKAPTAYGARADIFRKPAIAKILYFLRILPMVRQRDGLENVKENYETFDRIDEVLEHHVPFCLFAEGAHHPGRQLQPIKKGIARIALSSARQRQTWLVPTGINYSHFFRYRGTCEVSYGKPLDISAFVREHSTLTEPQLLQELRNLIQEKMEPMVTPEGPASQKMTPFLLLLWPLAALLSLPIWLAAEIICRKAKDKAWCNSIRFLCLLLLLPLTLILWAILFGLTLPWPATVLLLMATPFSYALFHDGLNLFRRH